MALRQTLSAPLVVDATSPHTHTVVFLHRYPEHTSDAELLAGKLLSFKMTRTHTTLQDAFPSVRWVFPFAKTGARPYANLSPADKLAVGLTLGGVPYIAQVVLQEANRAGGLDRVILGGQGETAVAAHEAMTSLPEPPPSMRGDAQAEAGFVQNTFHNPMWTDVTRPSLAGFVAMHGDDGVVTRDVARYAAATKDVADDVKVDKVNTAVLLNTPHRFIRGGYKVQTATWDGRRIDEFAAFLADDLGVRRDGPPAPRLVLSGQELMNRGVVAVVDPKAAAITEQQQHAQKVAREKQENEKRRELIKVRIEADKVERKIRQARARQSRLHAQLADNAAPAGPSQSPIQQQPSPQHRNLNIKNDPVGDGEQLAVWQAPSQVRGVLSAAQQEALGVVKKEET